MNIDPHAPAYPRQNGIGKDAGMSIRAEIASRILAGMCASPAAADFPVGQILEYAPANAIKLADALIHELNKPLNPDVLVQRITDALMTNGLGDKAHRLVMVDEQNHDLGGLIRGAVIDTITEILEAP